MVRALLLAMMLVLPTALVVMAPMASACRAGGFPDSPYGGLVGTGWHAVGNEYNATGEQWIGYVCGQNPPPVPAKTLINYVCNILIGEPCFQ